MKKRKAIALCLAALLSAVGVFAGCKKKQTGSLTVYMPDGAPALALAELMAADTAEDGVEYRVVKADAIAATLTYKEEEKNADLCVLPLTDASQHVGTGERYVMLGAVTHGNVYLVAKEGDYTKENLSALVGKKVGVLQSKKVPGLTFKATLNALQIPWQETSNEGGMVEDKVNLFPISGPNDVGVREADCFLLAEPAATAQSAKGYKIVGDLQALYGEGKGYPQAVLVAKKALVETRRAWVEEFVKKVENGKAWLQTASGEQVVATVNAHMEDEKSVSTLKAAALTPAVLGRLGISFAYASACKGSVASFLTALSEVDSQIRLPQSTFYWE